MGFAEEVFLADRRIHLVSPFTRAALATSRWGWIECRGTWSHPFILPSSDYTVASYEAQGWMWVELVDLIAAQQLCSRIEFSLPPRGFSRFRSDE